MNHEAGCVPALFSCELELYRNMLYVVDFVVAVSLSHAHSSTDFFQSGCHPLQLGYECFICSYRFRMLAECGDDEHMSAYVDPRQAATVNLVVAGLVNMVGLRTHNRLVYHGLIALANLAQDSVRTVPM